jgi:hypothetical protein
MTVIRSLRPLQFLHGAHPNVQWRRPWQKKQGPRCRPGRPQSGNACGEHLNCIRRITCHCEQPTSRAFFEDPPQHRTFLFRQSGNFVEKYDFGGVISDKQVSATRNRKRVHQRSCLTLILLTGSFAYDPMVLKFRPRSASALEAIVPRSNCPAADVSAATGRGQKQLG